ncbi:glycosyltransferase [Frondihabitans australicus]|uniref:Glycosyl transferase family 2 n=1 Tax=Frondihabitans australicus TaxID=386892 RepID=A0A495IC23_9MICO|nr:glycosyltransferase [Frondihabitans australicus]RKR73553.1 glycosyl transferase family 2 [Frondihabitans australicus]
MILESRASAFRVVGVVVNYNYERYVASAIRSLLEQTIPFDEIIVVDDGSTDSSRDVIAEFADRVTVISKENGGPLSAAFAALDATDCDYFYLLDADDVAEPDLLESLGDLLQSCPVKVQFQLRSMDETGTAIDSVFPSYRAGYDSASMIDDNGTLGFYVCAPTSGNVFWTDYLRFLRNRDLDERGAYDGVPAQVAPYFGDVVSVNQPLARYRVHAASKSSWGNPTVELMDRELTRYRSRWEQAESILRDKGMTPPRIESSAYVLERFLMKDALQGRRPTLRTGIRYAAAVSGSGYTLSQRVAFSLWAISLSIVPARISREMVEKRRSAAKRGRILAAVTRLARSR